MLRRVLALAALAGLALCLAAGARADEIIFKKEFGGEKVKCEVYKEDDGYVHYIDIKRKMDCGASKEIIEKIVREEKPLINVEAFFLKKAREAKGKEAREKAARLAEELRKAREAAEKEKKKAKSGEKRIGKCLVRPSQGPGIKLLPSTDTGSRELLVDPFPEEGGGPKEVKEEPKKRRKRSR